MARKAKVAEKKHTKKNHKVILTLDTKLHKELKEAADKLSLPVASLARMWVAEKVESMKPKARKR